MPRFTKLPSALVLLLWASLAIAQNNLGELLDAGAKKVSAKEFRQELVQRLIAGPTLSGGSLEVAYANNGLVQGTGSYGAGYPLVAPLSGEWTIDDSGRVCTTMRIGSGVYGGGPTVSLPSRCQFWFKYGDQYFLSDSDSDRRARVLRRTLKQ